MRRAGAAFAVGVTLLALCGCGSGAAPQAERTCGQAVLSDWADGRLDRTYADPCYLGRDRRPAGGPARVHDGERRHLAGAATDGEPTRESRSPPCSSPSPRSLRSRGRARPRRASGALYGVQDDAWLFHGPGTLESRLDELDRLGVDVVRYTVRWDLDRRGAPDDDRATTATPPTTGAPTDAVLRGLRRHGIEPVVTLYGTPRWANGGLAPNWAPTLGALFGDFARATATRYPWVRLWTIWNEPNKPLWLRPTSAATYVRKLLNPAYAQIHAVIAGARVGGGMTAPRAGSAGVSPVAWIKAMGSLERRSSTRTRTIRTRDDPQLETPVEPGVPRPARRITMADLERLVALVQPASRAASGSG